MKFRISNTIILTLITIIYIASWFLPVLTFQQGREIEIWLGYQCFLAGILFGFLQLHFEAFANLFFIPALLFAWNCKWKPSLVWIVLSLPFIIQTLFLRSVYFDAGPELKWYLTEYGSGFYLWVGSFLVLFILSLLKWRLLKQSNKVMNEASTS